ncbi:MAG: hypothetical protein APF81_06605 [Desulfosporosinus sp. BRH_c37]|nr:MAG: hypothetical protein APF81_06605 [Desulfosporosinus sp. BRH_c37]
MKISVILGHPQKGSLNHAIADKVVQTLLHNGYEVVFLDPLAQAHCQKNDEEEAYKYSTLTEERFLRRIK